MFHPIVFLSNMFLDRKSWRFIIACANQEKYRNDNFVHALMMLGWGRATQDRSLSLSVFVLKDFKLFVWNINHGASVYWLYQPMEKQENWFWTCIDDDGRVKCNSASTFSSSTLNKRLLGVVLNYKLNAFMCVNALNRYPQ